MYHCQIIPNGGFVHAEIDEFTLQAYIRDHEEALGHAATLLGGLRGARLINAIRETLDQPKPANRRLRRQLLELRNLLFLEYAYDENWSDNADFALLEPNDPLVSEICLLADGLENSLQNAGIIGTKDSQGT